MGIQIIVKTKTVSDIETALGGIASECEIFAIDTTDWGVSIPGKVINAVGEQHVEAVLGKLEYFDLWAGAWKSAKPK
jgi:hypothetical protein